MYRGGLNPFFKLGRLLCAVLLFTVSAAEARPTVTPRVTLSTADLYTVNTPAAISRSASDIVSSIDAGFVNLGREFLEPPTTSNAQSVLVKPLPAVPAAVLMVLPGLLCVSLVRDRKVWLAALAGVLCAGQTGFHALPQLALRLGRKNHIDHRLCVKPAYLCCFEGSRRLRSDIEGTQYIGLLRHLAGIPDTDRAPANKHLLGLIVLNQNHRTLCDREFGFSHQKTYLPQSAIISGRYGLTSLSKQFVSVGEQPVFFSPAFIFNNLARGPPEPS